MSNPIWTTPAAVMSTTRSQFAAATGPDDQIYLAGGNTQSGVADPTVDVYNPVDGIMNNGTMNPTTSPMTVGRYAFALVTAWDGGIWAICGFTTPWTSLANPGTATDSVERYDAGSNTWTPKVSKVLWSLTNNPTDPGNPSNLPRGAVAAAVGRDNRIYVLGGMQYPPEPPPPPNWTGPFLFNPPLSDVFSLDPFNPSLGWQTEPSMNVARAGHTAATGVDGNIYVFGGDTDETAEMLDFDAVPRPTWKTIDPMPPGNNLPIAGFATAAAPDGSIYSAGGHYTQPNSRGPVTQASAYTAYTSSSGAWITAPNVDKMFPPRDLAAAAVAEGELFVAGGSNPDPGIEAYGPLPAALSSSAAAWWRFDKPPDTSLIAVDSAGSNNGSIIDARHFSSGRVHQGLSFDGTDDYVDVPDSPSLNFDTGDLSVEFWVRMAAGGPVGEVPVLDKRTASGSGHHRHYTGYHVYLYTGGTVGLQLATGSGGYANYLSILAINPKVWTHVAISVDRTKSHQITFYINGVNANGVNKGPWTGMNDADIFTPLSGSIGTPITNPAHLYIGKHAFNNSYFQGALDELTLYNKALSWIEVRSIFLAGRAGKWK